MDYLLTVLTGESGRQLRESVTEAIQSSNPNELTEFSEDREL